MRLWTVRRLTERTLAASVWVTYCSAAIGDSLPVGAWFRPYATSWLTRIVCLTSACRWTVGVGRLDASNSNPSRSSRLGEPGHTCGVAHHERPDHVEHQANLVGVRHRVGVGDDQRGVGVLHGQQSLRV